MFIFWGMVFIILFIFSGMKFIILFIFWGMAFIIFWVFFCLIITILSTFSPLVWFSSFRSHFPHRYGFHHFAYLFPTRTVCFGQPSKPSFACFLPQWCSSSEQLIVTDSDGRICSVWKPSDDRTYCAKPYLTNAERRGVNYTTQCVCVKIQVHTHVMCVVFISIRWTCYYHCCY